MATIKNKETVETITITRKYTLIPVAAEDCKEWCKKVTKYTIDDLESRTAYRDSKGKDSSDLKERLEKFKNDGVFTKKIVEDYTYHLVRTAMEEESRRKNYILSWIFSEMRAARVDCMDSLKDKFKFIHDTIDYAYRKAGSKKGSLFDETEIHCLLQGYGVDFKQELTRKVKDLVKDGLLEGKISLPSYKLDSPFTVEKAHFCFEHEYDSYEELCEHIKDKESKVFMIYGGSNAGKQKNLPSIAKFQINFGIKGNKSELMATMLKVFSGEYTYCGSSIQISKNKIILNLSMKIPKIETDLDPNTVVGVDLGIAVPAVCALNNNPYAREYVGNAHDFIRIRDQIRGQRRRLQKTLKNTGGGHGRKKKLQPLERAEQKEKHFAETYCHMVSKRVVDFAVKNHAKYINVENLKGYDASDYILSNWSYYKLQQYITYKADRYGIEVRKINPCYTSQVCSVCGHYEEGQRKTQSQFVCANPGCKSHEFRKGMNADFNAACNIAKSTLFMDNVTVSEESKKEAREFYNIPEKTA